MYLKIIHKHLHESEFVQFSHQSKPSDTKGTITLWTRSAFLEIKDLI